MSLSIGLNVYPKGYVHKRVMTVIALGPDFVTIDTNDKNASSEYRYKTVNLMDFDEEFVLNWEAYRIEYLEAKLKEYQTEMDIAQRKVLEATSELAKLKGVA